MASIVLTAVGSAIGGPVGGAVGGILGAYLDNTFVYPALFGRPDPFKGPRLDDLQVQSATEGQPVWQCLGPENRLPGQVVWQGPLITVENDIDAGGGSGGGGAAGVLYDYFRDVLIEWCAPIDEAGIYAVDEIIINGKSLYKDGVTSALCQEVRHYPGTWTQAADPDLQAAMGGPAATPAYRGRALSFVKRLALKEFGAVLPQFNAKVRAHDSLSVGGAISKILLSRGWDADSFDVTRVPGCLRGYKWAGPVATAALLEPLLTAYSLTMQERNGVLTFYPRSRADVVTVRDRDLAAHSPGDDAPRRVRLTDSDDSDVPTAVSVEYSDPARDLQTGSQLERRQRSLPPNPSDVRLPITLRRQEARSLARTLLWRGVTERELAEVQLPPSYIGVLEGDVVRAADAGEEYTMRVEQLDRGANMLILARGPVTQSDEAADDGAADDSPVDSPAPYVPPEVRLEVVDVPALRDEDADRAGAYYAVCAADPEADWRGAILYSSPDGASYSSVAPAPNEAAIGELQGALGEATGSVWDDESELVVQLLEGELASATDGQVLAGANVAAVGDGPTKEVLAWANAELLAPRRYRLTRLLRGLRGTEHLAALGHADGAAFVRLTPSSTNRRGVAFAEIGAAVTLKAVATGGLVADADPVAFAPSGETLRPFAPGALAGTRDHATDDVAFSWLARSRYIVRPFGPDAPAAEPEEYEVELWSGAALRRTVTTASRSVAYTAAEQATDGATPGDPVTAKVRRTAGGLSSPQKEATA